MQNIDEKSIVLLTDFRLVVTELNQPCFTHTARWNDNQIIAVGNRLDKPGWFAHPIAKILRSDLSGHDEWIYNLRHRNIIFAKIIILFKLCKSNNHLSSLSLRHKSQFYPQIAIIFIQNQNWHIRTIQIQRQIQNTQLSVSIAINQCPISKFKIQNFKILGIP